MPMNSKEFLAVLANRCGLSTEETSENIASLIEAMTERLCEGDTVSVQGFGTFDVKKKNERVIVNPVSRQKMLVPPKLTLNFKPSINLKERFK